MRMVRLAIATTTSLVLVGTMASGALGQSPSPDPPPWFGGRVEMPEHGFALTVPEGWVARDPAGDLVAQIDVVLARWGRDHWVFPILSPPNLPLHLDAGPSLTPPPQVCVVWSWSPSTA